MTNDYSHGWILPLDQPVLEADDVHVWRLSLHSPSPWAQELGGLLADDEVARAQKFRFARDRDRFVIVRGILRTLVGIYLQISPARVRFRYSKFGKPALPASKQSGTVLNFNVSHSHELALLAFRWNDAIGVDLEYIRPEVVRERIAEQFFSRQEAATLRALPASLQPVAFFNCWTRKEAFIKATGEGLSRPLDQFSVSLAPGAPAGLLNVDGAPQELSKWLICEPDESPGYAAALALQRPVGQVRCWEYSL